MTFADIGLVALGGGCGASGRYAIGLAQARLTPWPGWTGVLLANLLGCLIIGVVAGSGGRDPWVRAVFMTGLAGALTTFSSFALDLALMVVATAWGQLIWCVLLSLAGGTSLILAGRAIGVAWFGASA
ncbi:MAG: CrcB family protein [Phycisphaerales bacterium]|jgi:CrcB protein|nr:CrcB family protein [Phycisphaerales bacterium]